MLQGDPAIRISDEAFVYLRAQRGRISDLSHDRKKWDRAYIESLRDDYRDLVTHLPETCDLILDIGSGLGGIDALLSRHYSGARVALLDGQEDDPVVVLHARTFNDMDVARRFLGSNGVEQITCISPACETEVNADLIISLQSWCFHYPPSVYLDYVRRCANPGAVIIVDIRKDRPEWRRRLDWAFSFQGIASEGKKYERAVFHA